MQKRDGACVVGDESECVANCAGGNTIVIIRVGLRVGHVVNDGGLVVYLGDGVHWGGAVGHGEKGLHLRAVGGRDGDVSGRCRVLDLGVGNIGCGCVIDDVVDGRVVVKLERRRGVAGFGGHAQSVAVLRDDVAVFGGGGFQVEGRCCANAS